MKTFKKGDIEIVICDGENTNHMNPLFFDSVMITTASNPMEFIVLSFDQFREMTKLIMIHESEFMSL